MPVGLLTLEIYIPDAHSLKDKRQVIRSLKDRLLIAVTERHRREDLDRLVRALSAV